MKMIKIALSVFVVLICMDAGVLAQEKKFQKRAINRFTDLNLDGFSNEAQSFLIKTLAANPGNLGIDTRKQMKLANGETLLYVGDGFVYKFREMNQHEHELIKQTAKGEKKFVFSIESELSVVSDEGRLMLNDLLDGESGGYVFYSPKVDSLGIYHPYYTFETDSDVLNDTVCIYSLERESKRYRLSLLTTSGQLLTTREFPLDNELASDVKLVAGRPCLLLNSYSSPATRLIASDKSFNIVWERNFNTRLSGYCIKANQDSKTIAYAAEDWIDYVDALSGKVLRHLVLPSRSYIFTYDFIMDGRFIAVVTGDIVNNSLKNSSIHFFRLKDGVKVYTEPLGDLSTTPTIVSGEDSFILIANGTANEYAMAK
jgi:hypothetical protein